MALASGENAVAVAPSGLVGFAQTPGGRNFFLMLGVAAVLAVMSGVWMWGKEPDYRVLFSNFSDRDGGAIVAALQQMNVPYKFAEGGGAILVPAESVHDARLQLASQGLPKGGNVGFELMENQKLGVSQFLEQVNFQRALEGELARSVQTLAAVQAARVHLALPKASVFVREQQKPTASVLLNLHGGRTLDEQQVSAIVHLVASSVPDLPIKNVTVVDQNGNLLSQTDKKTPAGLDASQLKYVQELQQSIVRRIESIVTPIVGAGNVRAAATADVDFSHVEQAAETYTPNQNPANSAIRSQQSSESRTASQNAAAGVPGALTNQPAPAATAPIDPGTKPASTAQTQPPLSEQKDMTVNYEVDKTVRYVQQPMGGIKRLSVAVVVNHVRGVDAEGKPTLRALTEEETNKITDLVREAMGFNKDRGDSLNVVNQPFADAAPEVIPEPPLWKRPEIIQMAMTAGKYLLVGIVLMYLYFAVLKPLIARIMRSFEPPAPPQIEEDDAVVHITHDPEPMGAKARTYQDNLDAAKTLARNDPKMVANVVKAWVGNE
ncbi:MAG TPA: flagellar basal-body MS-ring/collar protein FliF [Noviherbaspirillum sp.]